MALTESRAVVANHIWLAREDAADVGSTVGDAAKPAADDAAWVFMEDFDPDSFQVERTPIGRFEIFGSKLGKKHLVDVRYSGFNHVVRFSTQRLTALLIEALWSADGAVSAQFNPGEQGSTLRAWLKLQQYNVAGTVVNKVDLWGELQVESVNQNQSAPVQGNWIFTKLWSTLNTGTL